MTLTTGIWMMRAQAVMWLRYVRDCPVVSLERGPGVCGIPDAIGLTPKRRIIEVEIKRSMADFRNNGKKWRSRQRMRIWLGQSDSFGFNDPQQFYFFVESAMVEKCQVELPEWAGLMSVPADGEYSKGYCGIKHPIVRVPAPINKSARKLTIKECHRMAKHQTGTLSSVLNALARDEQKNRIDSHSVVVQSALPHGSLR